jgi:hypothetical protein
MKAYTISADGRTITCHRCGSRSANLNDVRERYCAACKRFLDDGVPTGRMNMQPRPGFNWDHVAWGRPDSPRSALCSYCSAGIGEDDVPLIMWRPDGSAAQFCDACMKTWWGMT